MKTEAEEALENIESALGREFANPSKCSICLTEIPAVEYLANDYVCNNCGNVGEHFPYASPSHFETYCPADRQKMSKMPDNLDRSEQ